MIWRDVLKSIRFDVPCFPDQRSIWSPPKNFKSQEVPWRSDVSAVADRKLLKVSLRAIESVKRALCYFHRAFSLFLFPAFQTKTAHLFPFIFNTFCRFVIFIRLSKKIETSRQIKFDTKKQRIPLTCLKKNSEKESGKFKRDRKREKFLVERRNGYALLLVASSS